jgi:endonuclease I
MKHIYFIFLLITSIGFAQIPSNYYSSADGLSGYILKSELKNIISNGHVDQGYGALYTGYLTSDTDVFFENDNTVLDMYSENPSGDDPYNYTHDTNGGTSPGQACGNYTIESNCYNREHLFPQGFFDQLSPMRTDIHHVVPTDGRVNGFRSNFPFGEVGTNLVSQSNITNPTQNGSKLGNSITLGYTDTVFEPIDEFKGDIARMLLYFAVRYEDNWDDTGWDNHTVTNNPLNGTSAQFYETWYINLLFKWHTQDPVSTREISRNTAAYNYQGNANPFIDNPQFVLQIWQSVLSTNDNSFKEAFNLYPNPTKSNVTIKLNRPQQTKIEVYDILGKKVHQEVISRTKEINTNRLKSGIYILKITQGNKTTSKKLVKQ